MTEIPVTPFDAAVLGPGVRSLVVGGPRAGKTALWGVIAQAAGLPVALFSTNDRDVLACRETGLDYRVHRSGLEHFDAHDDFFVVVEDTACFGYAGHGGDDWGDDWGDDGTGRLFEGDRARGAVLVINHMLSLNVAILEGADYVFVFGGEHPEYIRYVYSTYVGCVVSFAAFRRLLLGMTEFQCLVVNNQAPCNDAENLLHIYDVPAHPAGADWVDHMNWSAAWGYP